MDIKKIVKFAYDKHHGQFDKAGMPYIFHCYYVAISVCHLGSKYEIVAWCHDLIEDTDTTYNDLANLGLTSDVIHAIDCITKRKGKESYSEYLKRVMSSKFAIPVKIEDINHNMDLSRLPVITEKDYERNEKYANALNILNNKKGI